MKRLAHSVVAVAFGVLLVAASVLGGVMMTNPNVHSVDGAADELVTRGEGQAAAGAGILLGIAAVYTYDKYISNSPNTADLARADAIETKKEIYDQASIQKQNNELTDTAYSNYLSDTETIALMEGKNAYIRALENGSAESVARNRARDAVADYYALKQRNLMETWNVSVTVARSARVTAANTSNVAETYVDGTGTQSEYGAWAHLNSNVTSNPVNDILSHTLVNSSTVDGLAVAIKDTVNNDYYPVTFAKDSGMGAQQGTAGVATLFVEPPDSNYDRLTLVNASSLDEKWAEVESQNTQVQNQVDTFINGTYNSYQAGDINTSDLVDPYLGSREYGPENASAFQDWSLRTLSSMGLNSPENLSNIGRMNVTANGVTYTGILMSDENPAGGFTVGQTYNASELNGSQFVALDGGDAHELEGEFTLSSAETADGTTIQQNESVTYRNVTYETANTTEFKQLQEDLDSLTAELNARQQNLRNAGGGGLLPDFGYGGTLPIVLIAAGAAVVVLGRT